MKKVRVGIVGLGARGTAIGRMLLENPDTAEITGLADTSPERIQAALQTFGPKINTFRKYEEMFKGDGIDAVIVTTPDFTHEEICVSALKSGKHVFCEKPLAITVEGCDAIVEASRKSGKMVAVGFDERFVGLFQTAKKICGSGELGEIHFVEIKHFRPVGSTFFKRWNRFRKNSGGLLNHNGCHWFDIGNWILGEEPLLVSAVGGLNVFKSKPGAAMRCPECKLKDSCPDYFERVGPYSDLCVYNSEKDTFDNTFVIVEYANNKRAVFEASFFTPALVSIIVSGDKATLTGTQQAGENRIRIQERYSLQPQKDFFAEIGGGTPAEIKTFLDQIISGKKLLPDAVEGRRSTVIAVAAEESIRSGKTKNLQ